MKLCFRILLPLVFLSVFNSCSNEIDVLAPYQENASIYGLLDPNAFRQYIKINKVFTNPGAKAGDVAKISDSLYFDSITPELVEVETGKRIPLLRANVALKDSGLFATAPNYLYTTNERINPLYKYDLKLTLPGSGKDVSARTNVCYSAFLNAPVNITTNIFSMPTTDGSFSLNFPVPKNAKIFDVIFTFNYTEVNKLDTNIKTDKSFSWFILKGYKTSNQVVMLGVKNKLFYQILQNSVPRDPNVTRRFKPCQFYVISGNDELDNYIQASTPSIGIVQKQSYYSNIKNGVGIFASRSTFLYNGVELSNPTKTLITSDSSYRYLNFVR